MRVLDPGHLYELDNLDATDGQPTTPLRFVKRIGSKFPGNAGHGYPGATSQEVIRALIDRARYVDDQIDRTSEVSQDGHRYNALAIGCLRQALRVLEVRAAMERDDRQAADLIADMAEPELAATCPSCGHVLCSRTHT